MNHKSIHPVKSPSSPAPCLLQWLTNCLWVVHPQAMKAYPTPPVAPLQLVFRSTQGEHDGDGYPIVFPKDLLLRSAQSLNIFPKAFITDSCDNLVLHKIVRLHSPTLDRIQTNSQHTEACCMPSVWVSVCLKYPSIVKNTGQEAKTFYVLLQGDYNNSEHHATFISLNPTALPNQAGDHPSVLETESLSSRQVQ